MVVPILDRNKVIQRLVFPCPFLPQVLLVLDPLGLQAVYSAIVLKSVQTLHPICSDSKVILTLVHYNEILK